MGQHRQDEKGNIINTKMKKETPNRCIMKCVQKLCTIIHQDINFFEELTVCWFVQFVSALELNETPSPPDQSATFQKAAKQPGLAD